MTQLEKMYKSCEEFARNPKVGNIEFNHYQTEDEDIFCKRINGFDIMVTCGVNGFFAYINSQPSVKLQATTAQEAADEALELCRKEAQKLVDLLSEPKEENNEEHF